MGRFFNERNLSIAMSLRNAGVPKNFRPSPFGIRSLTSEDWIITSWDTSGVAISTTEPIFDPLLTQRNIGAEHNITPLEKSKSHRGENYPQVGNPRCKGWTLRTGTIAHFRHWSERESRALQNTIRIDLNLRMVKALWLSCVRGSMGIHCLSRIRTFRRCLWNVIKSNVRWTSELDINFFWKIHRKFIDFWSLRVSSRSID